MCYYWTMRWSAAPLRHYLSLKADETCSPTSISLCNVSWGWWYDDTTTVLSCIIYTHKHYTFPTVMRNPLMYPRVQVVVRLCEAADFQLFCVAWCIFFFNCLLNLTYFLNTQVQKSFGKSLVFIQDSIKAKAYWLRQCVRINKQSSLFLFSSYTILAVSLPF